MPHEDEIAMLREEIESLAAFLHMLQREYHQLQADFAAVLQAAGGSMHVPTTAIPTTATAPHIERLEEPATGAITFLLKEPTP